MGVEVVVGLQIDVLAEGEAAETVAGNDVADHGVAEEAHHARSSEDDLQLGIVVVAAAQLVVPLRLLEDLIDEQHAASLGVELASEVVDAAALEVEVVHVDVEATAVAGVKPLLGYLQQKRRLAHTARPLDANQATAPINLVHQGAPDCDMCMFDEIGMCSEKRFHSSTLLRYCKVTQFFLICKLYFAKLRFFSSFKAFYPLADPFSA